MPSGNVPVTRVAPGEDKWDPVKDRNQPEDTLSQDIRNALYNSVELPLVVQIIGSAYRDEVVLRVMREIEAGADCYQDK